MEEFAKAIENALVSMIDEAIQKAFERHGGMQTAQKEPETVPMYYTRRELETKFEVSQVTIWRWEKEKKIRAKTVKGRKVYPREEIDRLCNMGELGKYVGK